MGPRSERTTACVYLLQSPLLGSVVNCALIRYVPQHCLGWSCPGLRSRGYTAVMVVSPAAACGPLLWLPGLCPPTPRAASCTKSRFLSLLSSSVFRTLVNPTVLQSDAGLCPFLPYHSGLPLRKVKQSVMGWLVSP